MLKDLLYNPAARFIALNYRAKGTGELSRFVIQTGINYGKVLEKSILGLELTKVETEPEIQAKQEMLASFRKSLEFRSKGQQNPDYTKAGQYIPLGNGISINSVDNSIQIQGIIRSKVVLEKGEYKPVKSSPKTLAKKALQKTLPIGKWREFALENVGRVKLNGKVLEIS